MPESGRRVVLLARPGTARDRVRAALVEVGADLALEADPTRSEATEVSAAGGEVVIVVLDSATEAALDRFDAVLLDPAIDVMYEEAELAANRSGWDAARWTRHLAAKLHRHADVLPPGRPGATVLEAPPVQPSTHADAGGDANPGRAPAPALQVAAADTSDASGAVAGDVAPEADARFAMSDPESDPRSTAADAASVDAVDEFVAFDLAPVDTASGSDAANPVPDFDADPGLVAAELPSIDAAAFDFDVLAPLTMARPAHPLAEAFTSGVEPGAYAGFDPVEAEMSEFEFDADQIITFDPGLRDDFGHAATRDAPGPTGLELAFESELALPEIAPPAAQVDALQFQELSLDDPRSEPARPAGEVPAPASDVPGIEPVDAATDVPAPFAGVSGGLVLSLVTDDAPIATMAPAPSALHLADLDARIASLSLVEDVEPEPARGGAVLLVGGLGGPDAVRQVLAALPEGFPRPVLVLQRLDGGRYDRLVTQLQRATSLPVDLAEAGGDARPGVVHVLPDGVGLAAGANGIRFNGGDPFEALPPSDSAVLLLSGADATLADRLADSSWSRALVAGQSADGCYDATASNALAAHGRPTAGPAELARQLIERWGA